MSITDKAAVFAVTAHSGQKRKTGNIPYIVHPMEVAAIIATMTDNEDVIAAGLLHDTVEDCGIDINLIREEFGDYIFKLVDSETEDKMSELPPAETWMLRKKSSLDVMNMSDDINVKILWLGDKLSNIRSFYRLFINEGSDMWLHFNQKDEKKQAWYYRTVAECLSSLKDTFAYKEYVSLVDTIFGGVD